ncbi:HAMP domain-containing sensor histidine kinase [Clostridium thermobutyricum]|uniref:sensor histidine kinase n=1 Tax=Clostridium thermobutyricum TaxID=29372 RepID=UPI0029427A9C|nr:HAMP domain-containing sensor histidine kinase [Clostridium thermobutyricum]
MYLKNKWESMGIKKKLFIISTGIVVATSILIYAALFILFPRIYLHTKISNIKSDTDVLITKMGENPNFNYQQGINEYAYQNGAIAALLDFKGNVIYTPNKFERNMIRSREIEVEPNRDIFREKKTDYEIAINVYVKSLNQNCILKVSMPLRFKGDINRVIIIIFPIIVLITIALGVFSVLVYSSVISNPLLSINRVARDIAQLKFDNKLKPEGNDEFAELSNSINLISENLEKNISMLEKANEKLRKDIEREKEIDRKRRDFINAISHELKTPITVISGQVEGMIYNIGPYKNRDKYLKETLESVNELNSLAHEIISLAKIEEGVGIQLENKSINELVKEVLSGYEYFIEKEKLNISLNEKNQIFREIDKGIVKKILSNLIGNAVKYSRSYIEISIYENIIEIKNDVIESIDEKDIEEIFTPFYRGDKSRNKKKPGTGLGLYIVKSLIQAHGGMSYSVKCEDNIFEFRLNME